MSNYNNNAFRPQAQAPDLTRAPQHVKDALHATIPHRPGEVQARVITGRHMANVPNGRLYIEHARERDASDNVREFIVMRALDYQGLVTLAHVEITPEALKTFLLRVIDVYRTSGGDPETLLQPKDNT